MVDTSGRKRLPSTIRAQSDDPHTRQSVNPDEPVFETDEIENLPEAFADDPIKRDFWLKAVPQLVKAGVATNIDRYALECLVEKWAEYRWAQQQIEEHGYLVRAPSGYPQLSPYYSIAQKALKEFKDLMTEFGMTPSSRSGIKRNEAMTRVLDRESIDLSDLSPMERDQLRAMINARKRNRAERVQETEKIIEARREEKKPKAKAKAKPSKGEKK